jgi:lauroyl/myristoyl acyltransferase
MGTPEVSPVALPAAAAKSRPLVTLNDLLWLLYLYPVRLLANVLPRSILYGIGRLSGPLVQFHARHHKIKAVPWIMQACRTTPERARQIARRSLFKNIFGTLDELLLLNPAFDKMLRCSGLEGLEHLEAGLARGKGVILLVGHFRANRIAGRYLAMQGYRALSVHNERPSNKAEGRFGKRFLQSHYIELQKLAYPDHAYIQDPDCSLKIMRRLREGGLVIVQMDGRGGTRHVNHTFLNVAWRVPEGIFEIVRLSSCAVVPMLCLGRSDGFQIRFQPPLNVEPAPSREAFLSAHLPRFLAVVEKQVTENPEEWRLWNHF